MPEGVGYTPEEALTFSVEQRAETKTSPDLSDNEIENDRPAEERIAQNPERDELRKRVADILQKATGLPIEDYRTGGYGHGAKCVLEYSYKTKNSYGEPMRAYGYLFDNGNLTERDEFRRDDKNEADPHYRRSKHPKLSSEELQEIKNNLRIDEAITFLAHCAFDARYNNKPWPPTDEEEIKILSRANLSEDELKKYLLV